MRSTPQQPDAGDAPDASAARPPALAMQGSRATWHDLMLHLRVWLPFLMNGYDRRRLVRYLARDLRVGMQWTVELPHGCWHCGSTQHLSPRAWQIMVRCYESTMPILGGALVGLLFVVLLGLWLGWVWTLLSIAVVMAGASLLIWLKSWPEQVDLVLWTCPEHSSHVPRPDVVSDDDELYVFLPTEALAAAARQQLLERRQLGMRASDTGRTSLSAGWRASREVAPRPATHDEVPDSRPPFRYAPPPREELPPIKLVGDEEDDLLDPGGPGGDLRAS
jgi:hypothetical protein